MEGVLSGKNVRAGKAHEAEAGTIGSSADTVGLGGDTYVADGRFGQLHHVWVAVEHLFHVPVLLTDTQLDF